MGPQPHQFLANLGARHELDHLLRDQGLVDVRVEADFRDALEQALLDPGRALAAGLLEGVHQADERLPALLESRWPGIALPSAASR